MAVSESRTVTVNATADEVLTFLRDIAHQSDWFPGNSTSEVLESDDQGRCVHARLVNDVKVAKDEFELRYTHVEGGFSWTLVSPTRVQKHQTGAWTVVDQGGTCSATMQLTVETSLPLPGIIQRKTVKDTVKNTTNALVRHF